MNKISDDAFRKTEGLLYRHYKNIKTKDRILNEMERLNRSIQWIRRDMENLKNDIDGIRGINYEGVSVQTSGDLTGIPEKQVMELQEQMYILVRELERKTRKTYKNQAKVRELDENISYIDYALEEFKEQDKQYIEYKYGEGCGFRQIARLLPMSDATARRRRTEIVQEVVKILDIKSK